MNTNDFERRREAFIQQVTADCDGLQLVAVQVGADGRPTKAPPGTFADALRWLRSMINQGHRVAVALARHERESILYFSYDEDDPAWTPAWPQGVIPDVIRVSKPLTVE